METIFVVSRNISRFVSALQLEDLLGLISMIYKHFQAFTCAGLLCLKCGHEYNKCGNLNSSVDIAFASNPWFESGGVFDPFFQLIQNKNLEMFQDILQKINFKTYALYNLIPVGLQGIAQK